MTITGFYEANPEMFYVTALVIGLCVGSFLNVVIYRLPEMLDRDWNYQAEVILKMRDEEDRPQEIFNLWKPDSHCPHCKHKIRAYENIPVLSYVFLGGKCSSCKEKISIRYPSIEFVTGLLTLLIAYTFGPGIQGLAAAFLLWSLIALTMIDFDTQLLPDHITLPTLWLGLLININGTFTSLESAVIGAAAGYLSLWSVYWLFKLLTGKEGMGYGDFKLLAMLGAWLGWQSLFMIIMVGSVAGSIIGIILILLKQHEFSQKMSFGPYLALGGFLALVYGEPLITAWYSLFKIG